MTTPTAFEPIVTRMVALIANEFEPERIILFGSRARGDARPDSDVDLLVVMPDGTDETRATIAMHALLHTMPLPKDIVISTPSAIAHRGHVRGNVLYPESTDRSLTGRDAGLPESSAGAPAFAGRCRSEEPSLSVAQRGSGALSDAGARVREACAGMLARASDPGRRCERASGGERKRP